MENTRFNKRKFGLRLVTFPLIFGLFFIHHLFHVFKHTWHFLKYGGEYINFKQNEKPTIWDIYNMLKEIREKQNELKEYNT